MNCSIVALRWALSRTQLFSNGRASRAALRGATASLFFVRRPLIQRTDGNPSRAILAKWWLFEPQFRTAAPQQQSTTRGTSFEFLPAKVTIEALFFFWGASKSSRDFLVHEWGAAQTTKTHGPPSIVRLPAYALETPHSPEIGRVGSRAINGPDKPRNAPMRRVICLKLDLGTPLPRVLQYPTLPLNEARLNAPARHLAWWRKMGRR